MQKTGEPSVEEILDSIKQVIARDADAISERKNAGRLVTPEPSPNARNETLAEGAAEGGEGQESAADLEDHVLELAEQNAIDASADEEAEADDDSLVLSNILEDDFADAEEPSASDKESLINEDQRQSMRDNLAALAMISQPSKQPQIVKSGETSLESMARELLRPMLSEWLDANLPDMVESMVKAEIKKIAGKKGG